MTIYIPTATNKNIYDYSNANVFGIEYLKLLLLDFETIIEKFNNFIFKNIFNFFIKI